MLPYTMVLCEFLRDDHSRYTQGMFRKKPCDFSESEETLWMKEKEAGEFYKLYRTYATNTHSALLKVVLLESSRVSLGEKPSLLGERTFYKRVTAMVDEVRRRYLRDIIVGYEVTNREAEARISAFQEEHPMEEVPVDQLGQYVARMLFEGMGRKSKKKR